MTCQTGRHRQGSKRAPKGLQEVIARARKGPPNHQLPPVFLVLRTHETHRSKQHRKLAITGVLVQSKGPRRAPRGPKESQHTTSYHQCSWFCTRKKHVEQNNTEYKLSPVFSCNQKATSGHQEGPKRANRSHVILVFFNGMRVGLGGWIGGACPYDR